MSDDIKNLVEDFGAMSLSQVVIRSSLPEAIVRDDLAMLIREGIVESKARAYGDIVFFITGTEEEEEEEEAPVEHEFLHEEYEKGRLFGRQEVFKGMLELSMSFPDFPFPKGASSE
jgi:hypothetical protein